MKSLINGEAHNVLYIEYHSSIPHTVITEFFVETADVPYWRKVEWDFFANNGEPKDLCAFESGSGGYHQGVQAPHFIEGAKAQIWVADNFKLIGEIINGVRIDKPKRIYGWYRSSINPFKIADIVSGYEYCERCDCDSTDFCDRHKYYDADGNARYIDDNSMAQ